MSTPTYTPRFERQPGLSFLVTERDIEILKVINRYRYLRTGQIKRLIFADNSSLQSTRRRLRFLFHNGTSLGWCRTCNRERWRRGSYYLDKQGEQCLRDLDIKVLRPTKRVRSGRPSSCMPFSSQSFVSVWSWHSRKTARWALHRFVCDFELKSHLAGPKGGVGIDSSMKSSIRLRRGATLSIPMA